MLTVLSCEAMSVVEPGLVCFGEEARACGFWFVVDKLEDGVHVLGGVTVRLTGLPACVNVVKDLL